jgi:hypothetical protein
VLLQPLLIAGQTTSAKNAILSNTAPPDGTTTGLRFAISQAGRSAVFATLMVTYDNGVIPDVSAHWLRMPSTKRAGQIEVDKNGVPTIVYFAYPDLTPVSGAAAIPAAVVGTSMPSAVVFSSKAIDRDSSVLEESAASVF